MVGLNTAGRETGHGWGVRRVAIPVPTPPARKPTSNYAYVRRGYFGHGAGGRGVCGDGVAFPPEGHVDLSRTVGRSRCCSSHASTSDSRKRRPTPPTR